MPDLIATLNRYSPKTGAVIGTLALYSDGSANIYGDEALVNHAVDQIRKASPTLAAQRRTSNPAPRRRPSAVPSLKRTSADSAE